jgi:hypothetical protein
LTIRWELALRFMLVKVIFDFPFVDPLFALLFKGVILS